MIRVLFLIALLFCCSLSRAELYYKGFVDSYHGVRLKEPNDYISNRVRFRGELQNIIGPTMLFTSFNMIENKVIEDNNGFELREAFMEYVSSSWDLRVGRQIIVWGKADGIAVTDIISPRDLTEFLARDYDDIRVPVDAVKFRVLRDVCSYEFIWLPNYEGSILPGNDNPWNLNEGNSQKSTVTNDKPENKLENSEFAGKVTWFFPSIEFAASWFHTWNDLPVRERKGDNVALKYHRLNFYGLEFSFPWRELVVRGEGAFYQGNRFTRTDGSLTEKDKVHWMLGFDWFAGGNLTVITQFSNEIINGDTDRLLLDSHQETLTFNVEKKLMRETLTISNMIYWGLNENDCFDRFSCDYALSDELHVIVGCDLFAGDEGMYGRYEDNSDVWIKAKYSF